MNIGDKIRFLNDVGGGTVVGFQGKDLVLVRDDDGFDVPTPIRECVVVNTNEYNIPSPPPAPRPEASQVKVHAIDEEADNDPADRPVSFRPAPIERRGGDVLNLLLALVPQNVERIDSTLFDVYLVNDSNYTLHVALLSHDEALAALLFEGEVEANTKLLVDSIAHGDLPQWERITVQAVAFKRGKSFAAKAPVNVGLRVNGPKCYRKSAFTPSCFFDVPSLRFHVVSDDHPTRSVFVAAEDVRDVLVQPKEADRPRTSPARTAQAKADDGKSLLEVDLHAHELLDSTAGLAPHDILEYQLAHFRRTMDEHLKQRGRKIVFIHGKGEGVLRAAIVKELKSKYKTCRWQDASFREYGFGATLVVVG